MRVFTLRTHMIALALGAVLPVVVFALVMGAWLASSYRDAAEQGLTNTVRTLALAVDDEIQTWASVLATLATSPSLDAGDLAAFYAQASDVAARHDGWVVLCDRDENQLINTRLPFGASLPRGKAPEGVQRVFTTGEVVIPKLFKGPVAQQAVLALAAPVRRGGNVKYALIFGIDPRRLSRLLIAQGLGGIWFSSLTDEDDRIIARSRDLGSFVGRVAPAWFREAKSSLPRIQRGTALEGHEVVLAFEPLRHAPWYASVAMPLAEFQAAWSYPLQIFAFGAAALVALVAAAAWWWSRQVAGPLNALLRGARAVVQGSTDVLPLPRTHVAEIALLAETLMRAEEALRTQAETRAKLATAESIRLNEERMRLATEGTGIAWWDVDVATGEATWSKNTFSMMGYTPAADGRAKSTMWRRLVHPDDAARVAAAHAEALRTGELYACEHRILRADDGAEIWVSPFGRYLYDESGRAVRFVGVFSDVTARKRAEERQTLLMTEVDHRAKNMLAVVTGLLRITKAETVPAFVHAVEGRVAALARVHTLLADNSWDGADLRTLAARELGLFASCNKARLEIDGPSVVLAPASCQPVGMMLHELATNAVKFGALSVPGGRVTLMWTVDQKMLLFRWLEQGGPAVRETECRGLGLVIIEQVVEFQLDGTVKLDWRPDGLAADISLPLRALLQKARERAA